MSWRKLKVLIDWLPEDSLTWTRVLEAMPPAERAAAKAVKRSHGRWSRTNHLLASIDDSIRAGNWQYVASKSKPGQAGPPPQPIPRPGLDNVRPISEEAAEFMDAYLERVRANHGSTGEGA